MAKTNVPRQSISTALPRSRVCSARGLPSVFLFLAVVISSIGWAGHAEAIQNPSIIAWKASPSAFIDSLFRGVLGRNPGTYVVDDWARQVTDPKSRRRIFWAFVNSPEWRARFQPSGDRTWSIWTSDRRGTIEFVAAERHPGDGAWYEVDGPHYQLVARAVLGWYLAYGAP